MEPENILEIARNVSARVEVADIEPLSGGFSSQAYKVAAPEPFVLLVARSGGLSETRYENAYAVLTLLKKRGLDFAPDPLWLADDRSALAISHFDGTASDAFDFAANAVDARALALRVIDSLYDVTEIPLAEYREAARSAGTEPLSPETQEESARKYGTEWFEIVERSCPDPDIVEWLRPRIRASADAASAARCEDPRLAHSDPSNPNILIAGDGSFKLIDWSSARPHCSWAQYLVGYATHLTDFMKPFQDELVAHVAGRLRLPEREFADSVRRYRMHAEVFDVNWAAMMMARVSAGDIAGDLAHFRALAVNRIREYDEAFS